MKLIVARGGFDLLDGELRHLQVGGHRHRRVRRAPEQLQLACLLRDCKEEKVSENDIGIPFHAGPFLTQLTSIPIVT